MPFVGFEFVLDQNGAGWIWFFLIILNFLRVYWKIGFKSLNPVEFSSGMVHGGFQLLKWKQKIEKESPFSIISFY